MGVTVAIATIPPRRHELARAVTSVLGQTRPADDLVVVTDRDGIGAWWGKNRALSMVQTEWVAFLDDDDELLPDHLEVLCDAQQQSGADLVWPYYRVHGGTDPHASTGRDPATIMANPRLPTPVLTRTALARSCGGFQPPHVHSHPAWDDTIADEWGLWRAMLQAGATFEHVDRVTWVWHHHAANTSGRPWRERVTA